MNMKQLCAAVFVVCAASGSVWGQATGSQKFRVVVPSSISITPPAEIERTHDESDNDLIFPDQQWLVKGNVTAGVSVSFATNTSFRHTTDGTSKRDARLNLAVASSEGPGAWTVSQATDVTNYVSGDESATVSAASNGVGRATFDLGVEFVTNTFGTFAAGNYETTVVGTVTAN